MKIRYTLFALAASSCMTAATLGSFTFDPSQFGDTLIESDGGVFSANNWLNVVNADPGNPGYLTGANFDTGIANIGFMSPVPFYTIGYSIPIVNRPGADVGLVSARYSESDTFQLEVSTDGATFSSPIAFGPGAATATGVIKSYFYGGGGPFRAELFVTPIDFSAFGLAIGESVYAIRVTSSPEGDLIRIAGFARGGPEVPEPGTWMLIAAGVGALALFRRK